MSSVALNTTTRNHLQLVSQPKSDAKTSESEQVVAQAVAIPASENSAKHSALAAKVLLGNVKGGGINDAPDTTAFVSAITNLILELLAKKPDPAKISEDVRKGLHEFAGLMAQIQPDHGEVIIAFGGIAELLENLIFDSITRPGYKPDIDSIQDQVRVLTQDLGQAIITVIEKEGKGTEEDKKKIAKIVKYTTDITTGVESLIKGFFPKDTTGGRFDLSQIKKATYAIMSDITSIVKTYANMDKFSPTVKKLILSLPDVVAAAVAMFIDWYDPNNTVS